MGSLSPRSYQCLTTATSWKEIWEAGPYYERVSTLLEGAQRYAIFTGWQIDSRLPMSGGPHGRETLKEKVLRLCAEKPDLRIYFLMWDHSYFYVAEREFWQGRIWDLEHPRIHFIFDNRHPFGGAHHEKIILFDGTRALCGGIDLCDDRWDSPEHLYYDVRRSFTRDRDSYGPYHDLAVEISGPVCQVLQANISRRWRALSDVPFPELPPIEQGAQTRERSPAVYVSRTQSDVDASRKMVREIEFLFRDLIGSAERRILLEGQYFWSREITDLLIAKMQEKALERARAPELPPFELVIILAELGRSESFTRMMAGYEGSLLRRLYLAARSTGTRLTMGTPYAHAYPGQPEGATAPPPLPIYVHSKLVLIDDRYLCVGSANFAARALRIDTEINLTFEARTPDERSRLRALHTRILEHWGASPSGPRSEPSNIHLHPFTPEPGAASSRTITLRPPRSDVFLMSWLFDPTLPWGYLFKKRLHSIARRKPHWIGASTALIAMLSTLAALGLSGAAPGWAWVFAGLMAAARPVLPDRVDRSAHAGSGAGRSARGDLVLDRRHSRLPHGQGIPLPSARDPRPLAGRAAQAAGRPHLRRGLARAVRASGALQGQGAGSRRLLHPAALVPRRHGISRAVPDLDGLPLDRRVRPASAPGCGERPSRRLRRDRAGRDRDRRAARSDRRARARSGKPAPATLELEPQPGDRSRIRTQKGRRSCRIGSIIRFAWFRTTSTKASARTTAASSCAGSGTRSAKSIPS
jgi:phospholipase D1/2